MKTSRRRYAAAAAGLVISPAVAVLLPAATALAHGYVSAPPSRQAQCAQKTVQCGQIQYEPQSVEGPKGLRSCSGGNGRFSDLDDDGKAWKAATVGKSVTFTWTFTAKHPSRDYEYYIGNTRVGMFKGDRSSLVAHTVDLSAFTGRQKVLAIWNIADTANAFYACIDLEVQ
ncbi:lytic polysaccharide monooxygenase [Actinomadura graeca]|uniref:Lytic polysaccharide monooxygenase n=1 Tax=Actinomadura graeca TaxID=2750812 RepID=A0ABX8QXA2_9ACTN|nr:lytic polysaccharide monooxygenase auxiliary activity family 9 protein [Actinomadura graeca]QXJ23357.1 lytic polysaccharide monooxygenase [Actinomadura graeca]